MSFTLDIEHLTASLLTVFPSCRSVSQRVNLALQTQGRKTTAAILNIIKMTVINVRMIVRAAAYLVFRSWFSSS